MLRDLWESSPGADKLERGFQNGTCQHEHPYGTMSFYKWLLPVTMSQDELQLPPNSWEALQDHQVGLTQAPFKLLSCLGPQCMRFYVCPLRVESLCPMALWLSRR